VAHGGLGYLVKPVDTPQLVPAIQAALARAVELRALEAQKAQMEQALAGSRVASVAIGILMERRGLDRVAAFSLLRDRARSHRRKLDDVSEELVRALETLNSLQQ